MYFLDIEGSNWQQMKIKELKWKKKEEVKVHTKIENMPKLEGIICNLAKFIYKGSSIRICSLASLEQIWVFIKNNFCISSMQHWSLNFKIWMVYLKTWYVTLFP